MINLTTSQELLEYFLHFHFQNINANSKLKAPAIFLFLLKSHDFSNTSLVSARPGVFV